MWKTIDVALEYLVKAITFTTKGLGWIVLAAIATAGIPALWPMYIFWLADARGVVNKRDKEMVQTFNFLWIIVLVAYLIWYFTRPM